MKTNPYFLRKICFKRYLFAILLFSCSYMNAQVVNVSGNWLPTIPAITEAGNNYSGTYDNTANTGSNQITLSGTLPESFIKLLSNSSAKITMHYTSNAWNSSLGLSAKRVGGTGNVTGVCLVCSVTINGGTTYLPIPQASDVTLVTIAFSGLLGLGNNINYSGIVLHLQLSGVSVTVPANTYSSRVVFTVVAN